MQTGKGGSERKQRRPCEDSKEAGKRTKHCKASPYSLHALAVNLSCMVSASV